MFKQFLFEGVLGFFNSPTILIVLWKVHVNEYFFIFQDFFLTLETIFVNQVIVS